MEMARGSAPHDIIIGTDIMWCLSSCYVEHKGERGCVAVNDYMHGITAQVLKLSAFASQFFKQRCFYYVRMAVHYKRARNNELTSRCSQLQQYTILCLHGARHSIVLFVTAIIVLCTYVIMFCID